MRKSFGKRTTGSYMFTFFSAAFLFRRLRKKEYLLRMTYYVLSFRFSLIWISTSPSHVLKVINGHGICIASPRYYRTSSSQQREMGKVLRTETADRSNVSRFKCRASHSRSSFPPFQALMTYGRAWSPKLAPPSEVVSRLPDPAPWQSGIKFHLFA